ncbi:YcaO-like family protein [Arthrobacter sp.]|uniref:YcaO-like family protein n=1 Tax=Arthrobacter sp. TaxID=1667 RepID=UPI002811C0A6|nr:YcaO-like family protein [Arthrobacter sp.]
MAVDYVQTLNPDNGLARSVRILRPDGTNSFLWTVAVDIGQERLDGPDAGIDMSWVGAAGIRRAPTLARAAGEAVERSALIPGEGLASGGGLPLAPRGACWADTSTVPALKAYAATRYERDGIEAAVAVPAAAVDFPPAPGVLDLFDPGPSGTAAGIDLAMAEKSAAKEIIERSSAMLGWDQPETALRYNLHGNGFCAQTLGLATAAAGQGVELELVLLREPHGHAVWMAVAIDTRHMVVGAGLGLEQDPSQGVLRAVQESLQIRSLLINLKDFEGWRTVVPPITSEMARARYWAADTSVAGIREWLDRIPRADRPPRSTALSATQSDNQERRRTWLDSLPGYTMVDLTPRLPPAIREMGWCAVKIFCDTLQPLRMSDALDWNVLNVPPIAKQHQGNARPHPFI